MIFVTVGTHEQPFNRLIKYIDHMKKDGLIQEDVIIQTGYSTYVPQYCKWKKLYSYQDMEKLMNEARIIITHGGPSSFIAPLQRGKIPIVVPRKHEFHEHVNDHQVTFSRSIAERMGAIIVIEDIFDLPQTIMHYDEIVRKMKNGIKSNNMRFNKELDEIVKNMFKETKKR